jgi:peptidyl-prolyl cis-trans isomerase C
MSPVNHFAASVVLAALMLAPAAAQETTAEAPADAAEAPAVAADADTVVATVNGQAITLGHMIVARARLDQQYQALPDEMLFSGILDQLIQQIALGSTVDGPLSKGSELALENERRSFMAGEALTKVALGSISEDDLNALFTERYAGAEPTEEYNAAHILVETEEEAVAIKAEIDGGADFGEIALAKSTGPSGPNGGDLGWFEKGMMVPEFEAAVLALEPGQVSGPVQTQFGWHIIKMNEKRLKDAPTLDDVRDELTEELQRKAIDAAIAGATEAAEIVRSDEGMDPAILRNLDLIDQ